MAGAALDPLTIEEPDDAESAPSQGDHEARESVVEVPWHGQRLDRCLVAMAPEFSRSHLQGLIERGHVQLDGVIATAASRRLRIGQRLRLELVPTAESQAFRPERMDLAIVHEDDHLLVIDKPAGLVVHPAPGHWSATLLNGLLAHHEKSSNLPRAGIVHRLDKDTTGLMVVAKTLPAMTALVRAIAAREVGRRYLALAHGQPKWEAEQVDAPIGRDPISRLKMTVIASGKPSRTDVQRLAVRDAVVALRCTLQTGRTHQIRVHLAHRGHPLVGDVLYGGRPELGLNRQALHAAELAFVHPGTHRAVSFSSPLPTDLAAAWRHVTGL